MPALKGAQSRRSCTRSSTLLMYRPRSACFSATDLVSWIGSLNLRSRLRSLLELRWTPTLGLAGAVSCMR